MQSQGFLVSASSSELLTLIVSREILTFPREQVVELEELDLPEGLGSASGVRPVWVELADAPADVEPDDPSRARSEAIGHLPFALAVRGRGTRAFDCPNFKLREYAFLEENGLRS